MNMQPRRLAYATLLAAGSAMAACGTSADRVSSTSQAVTPAVTQIGSDSQGTWNRCNSTVNFKDYGGGPRPGPATLVPILWGFLDDAATDRTGRLDAFYSQLESSNYYKWVQEEYGAPALTHLAPASLYAVSGLGTSFGSGETGPTINEDWLKDDLKTAVRSGALPGPQNAIYVIHLPPGITTTKSDGTALCGQYLGYNGVVVSPGILNGGIQWDYYIVVPDFDTCAGYAGWDKLGVVLSHEILENVTDPVHNPAWPATESGWQDPTQTSICQQIGDLCNVEATTIDSSIGYTDPSTGVTSYTASVQKLWSNQVGACVTEDKTTAPTVTGMSPTVGAPGSVVTISGTNFEGHPPVTFGSTPSPSVNCPSSTVCYATVPPGQDGAAVTITVNDFTFAVGQFFYQECSVTTSCGPQVEVQCTADPAGYPIVVTDSIAGNQPFTVTLPASGFAFLPGVLGTDSNVTTCTEAPGGAQCATVTVTPWQGQCGGTNNCVTPKCMCEAAGGTWDINRCVLPCGPTTCAALGAKGCGQVSDGCGGVLECPPCPPCVPTVTCKSLHATCATKDDCGNPLYCGMCDADGGAPSCSNGTCCPAGEVGSDGICCPAGQVNTDGHCCPSGDIWTGIACVHIHVPPPPPM